VVLSKSAETGEISYKRVVNTFIRQTDEIYNVNFTNNSILETTWNHPFRRFKSVLPGDAFSIENSEWTEARDLKKGDHVYSADGSLLVVESVIIEQREETVYNFEVEDFHTYFVGEDGVWVHNEACYLQDPSKYNIAKRSLKGITNEEILEAYGGDIDALGLFRAGQSNEAFLTYKLKQLRNQGIGETEIENQLVSDILKIANTSGIKDTLKLRAYIDGMRDVLVFEGYAKEDKNFKLTVGAAAGSLNGAFGKYPAIMLVKSPKGWIPKPSQKGGGIFFEDPKNPHNNLRQMPGNPKSPNQAQQKPYVIFKKNGVAYDSNGKPLKSSKDPLAHIPKNEFDINKMPKLD
jgi:hypothetical protein